MLTHLALSALVLAASPQAAKPPKRAPKAPAAAAKPAEPTSKPVDTILRTAECVLVLKGTMERRIAVTVAPPVTNLPKPKKVLGGGTTASPEQRKLPPNMRSVQKTTETFEYELPGFLTEEQDPRTKVLRFRFTPAKDLKEAKAVGKLHVEDQAGGPDKPVTVVDGTELMGADPFIFEAEARGRDLAPKAGMVVVRGLLANPQADKGPVSMALPTRPVVSLPLPVQAKDKLGMSQAILQFQGTSLWAWETTRNPFTVAATIVYAGTGGDRDNKGRVEATFRIGATR